MTRGLSRRLVRPGASDHRSRIDRAWSSRRLAAPSSPRSSSASASSRQARIGTQGQKSWGASSNSSSMSATRVVVAFPRVQSVASEAGGRARQVVADLVGGRPPRRLQCVVRRLVPAVRVPRQQRQVAERREVDAVPQHLGLQGGAVQLAGGGVVVTAHHLGDPEQQEAEASPRPAALSLEPYREAGVSPHLEPSFAGQQGAQHGDRRVRRRGVLVGLAGSARRARSPPAVRAPCWHRR